MSLKPKLSVVFWSGFALYAAFFARVLATTPNTLRSIPALAAIARTGGERARYIAGELLAKRGEAGVAVLLELASAPDLTSRRVGVSGLWRVRPAPKKAVPALIGALKDDDRFVRSSARGALERIGTDEAKAALANEAPR